MNSDVDPPRVWRAALAMAVTATAARAALAALQDGYLSAGLWVLGGTGFCSDLLSGLPIPLLALTCVALVGTRTSRPFRGAARMAVFTLLAVAAYAFVASLAPHRPAYVASANSLRGVAGQAAAVLAGLLIAARMIAALCVAGPGPRRVPREPWLAIDVAALLLVLASAGVVLPGVWRQTADPERWNVVLISVDTLRADHVGCYGSEAPTTPNIDALAERGLRFSNAYTSRSWTLAAHMTLLTSLQPSVHTVDKDRSLPAGVPTLAQAFQAEGYMTGAIVDSIVWLAPRFGFDRGFDVYKPVDGGAGVKNEAAFRLLEDVGERPFFLFLHYYDVHSDLWGLPYESDEQDKQQFTGWYDGPLAFSYEENGSGADHLLALIKRRRPLQGDDLRYLKGLYDAGVRTLDRQLGELFAELDRRGLTERTVVVLASDHGEEFFDHGQVLHGQSYEECQSIPLIVCTPDMVAARVSDAMVELADIGPTLAELCGVPFAPAQGLPFADIVRGGPDRPGRDYILQDQGGDALGVRTRTEKLLLRPRNYELFDMAADPGEHDNLLKGDRQGDRLDRLMGLVQAERQRSIALRAELGIELQRGASATGLLLDESELEKLRALGYVGDN